MEHRTYTWERYRCLFGRILINIRMVIRMFEINDILYHTQLKEKVRLIGVDYNPNTKRIIYLTERNNEEIMESDFYSLQDIRYR